MTRYFTLAVVFAAGLAAAQAIRPAYSCFQQPLGAAATLPERSWSEFNAPPAPLFCLPSSDAPCR